MSCHRKKPKSIRALHRGDQFIPVCDTSEFLESILFTVTKSDVSHKMEQFILWERSDFITVNKLISKKHTCIVHGNELISKMKSSNRLGFFSMARYGHPPVGKKFITPENVFTFS